MTRLERKFQELKELRAEYTQSASVVNTTKNRKLRNKIARLEEEIAGMSKPQQLSSLGDVLDRDELKASGLLGWILQMHLCADIFCEAASNYKQYMLEHHDVRDSTIHRMAEIMEKDAAYIAGFACKDENNALSRLIVDDGELLDSVRELIMNYIISKLNGPQTSESSD